MAPVIEARGLTKLYSRGRGIDGLDLAVYGGEIFGYLGPNGAGKTTTIRLMVGLIRASRGQLNLFGERLRSGGSGLRQRIGYLPGDLGLHESYTGDQALRFFGSLSGGKAANREWLCSQLAFTSEDRRRRIRQYSKGMKQKLGIIQALQHDPDLIILDEPTGGLDPLVQESFFDVLRELRDRGRTVFFSSHVLSEVQRLCDRVGVVREAKLVLNSTMSELAATSDRLLWVKTHAALEGTVAQAGSVPPIARARFLRSEAGGWLVYTASAGDAPRIMQELAQLRPIDFRFESALEESFLKLYGVRCDK